MILILLLGAVQVSQDGGAPVYVPRINCVGPNVVCTPYSGYVNISSPGGSSVPSACNSGEALTSNGSAVSCTSTLTASAVACTACVQNGEIESVAGSKIEGAVATATALAANPTACSANQWVSDMAADGTLVCTQPGFSSLSGGIAVSQMASGTNASASTFWRGDGTWAAAGGGSDPWTYLAVNGGSDFTTTSATAVDVTGLTFAPSANTKYEFECKLLLRTATATVNPRVGFAWSTGLTDGAAVVQESQAATGTPLYAGGNPNAALLVAVGGLPNATQSWPAKVDATLVAGASPSGNTRVQLASETAGTVVTVKSVGSFCRWRTRP